MSWRCTEQKRSIARTTRFGGRMLLAGSLLALAAGGFAFLPFFSTPSAEAVEVTYVAPNELEASSSKTEIELASDAFRQARSTAIAASVKAAATQMHIEALEARMPAMQERSDKALREMYKMQQNRNGIIETLLSSESLDDFFQQTEYLERVGRANLRAINDLKQTRATLESARERLESARTESNEVMRETSEALDAVKADRAAKQSAGIASAQSQAVSLGGEASVGKDGSGNDQPEDYREAASTETEVLNDGADWFMSEEQFISEWAPRIDAYLAGSPLEGQGVNFARSSWKYCVDPRWSPAISNTESSKGAYCIRPHNAWGWGAADSDPYNLASEWASWEEAIDAHVRGLANGYGYTITIGGARAYCPYTWQSWYNNTLSQMAQI